MLGFFHLTGIVGDLSTEMVPYLPQIHVDWLGQKADVSLGGDRVNSLGIPRQASSQISFGCKVSCLRLLVLSVCNNTTIRQCVGHAHWPNVHRASDCLEAQPQSARTQHGSRSWTHISHRTAFLHTNKTYLPSTRSHLKFDIQLNCECSKCLWT